MFEKHLGCIIIVICVLRSERTSQCSGRGEKKANLTKKYFGHGLLFFDDYDFNTKTTKSILVVALTVKFLYLCSLK